MKNLEKQLTHLSGMKFVCTIHFLSKTQNNINKILGFIESGEDFKNNIGSWEKTVMDRGENFKLGMVIKYFITVVNSNFIFNFYFKKKVEGLKRCGDWQNSVNQQFSKLVLIYLKNNN